MQIRGANELPADLSYAPHTMNVVYPTPYMCIVVVNRICSSISQDSLVLGPGVGGERIQSLLVGLYYTVHRADNLGWIDKTGFPIMDCFP